jgi:type VI secretion system secreted protein VgrG
VGQSLAGANFGAVFTPRVGQEVLVDFLGGDIDRPVIVGAVYNGRGAPDAQGNRIAAGAAGARGSAPAWFAGSRRAEPPGGHHEGPREGGHADDPEGHQHPAVLLGHRSQELGHGAPGHGGASQLVFDDSAAGHRIELSTTPGPGATTHGSGTQAARLQLGALRRQQGNQRLAPRGHGLELATDDHGALRAGAGLLLSAHAQPPSTQGGGQQLDTRAAQQVLQAARDLAHTLADSAQAHDARLGGESPVAGAAPAQGMHRNQGQQLPAEHGLQALAESLAATGFGPGADAPSDAGVVAGADQDAPAPTAGGLGSVPAWGRPDLVLAAPAGIGLFTPAAALLAAGTHLTLGAGQDLLAVAQGHHASVAKDGVVLYTHGTPGRAADPARSEAETGIALHAASGSVHASSNTGATRLTARDAVEVTSTQAGVLVASPQQIRLSAAGAALEIGAGGIMVKAPGAVKFKASMKNLTGAARAAAPGLRLPVSEFGTQEVYSQKVDLMNFIGVDAEHGNAYAQVPYTVRDAQGHVVAQGTTSLTGETERLYTKTQEALHLYLGEGEWQVFAEGTGSPPGVPDDDIPHTPASAS